MKVRLGYVALSKALEDVTASRVISYTNYEKENFPVEKLDNIIKSNLVSLDKIIDYNIKNDIYFYRLTSKLIPLSTHPKVNYDYIKPYEDEYIKIGNKIRNNDIRVDMHPDQYTVLNSTKKEVVKSTFRILEYHYKILKALGIKYPVLILHVGSNEFGKKASITRFINNFNKLPEYIQKCIAVENDDKIFDVKDVLELCNRITVPMVLDYHHYICNNSGEKINIYLKDIFNTWKNQKPKIHFSSPKNNTKKDFRSHHDYINSDDFINFINILKEFNVDVDIMLEAKAKDDALFRLVRQIKYKTNYNFINATTFEV